jgi:hypothetical protein
VLKELLEQLLKKDLKHLRLRELLLPELIVQPLQQRLKYLPVVVADMVVMPAITPPAEVAALAHFQYFIEI